MPEDRHLRPERNGPLPHHDGLCLHDIGKVAIDDRILNAHDLTPEQTAILHTHPILGAQMLENLSQYQDEPLVKFAIQICRWHHERWDGSGYPDGRKGDDIPIAAQW